MSGKEQLKTRTNLVICARPGVPLFRIKGTIDRKPLVPLVRSRPCIGLSLEPGWHQLILASVSDRKGKMTLNVDVPAKGVCVVEVTFNPLGSVGEFDPAETEPTLLGTATVLPTADAAIRALGSKPQTDNRSRHLTALYQVVLLVAFFIWTVVMHAWVATGLTGVAIASALWLKLSRRTDPPASIDDIPDGLADTKVR